MTDPISQRFSAFISMCGLTQQEAADHLGIAKRTVAMKATGLRKPTPDEMRRVLDLWQRLSNLDVPLPDDYPAGARERQAAMIEARDLILPPDD
ncbi:helix-turn-helix domain-containing protein [Aureimonas psammosilenae]|uniref:helix-turn-helix domain-containing protein n=1 Tax=Aureimonas psammosilenae TaxID=2495496 RepID=UPI001260ECBB|nr:helix-turn-helix transcriptional regulator [Aureimonas psammosilenae]